jgi:copper chaperone CopZ
LIESRRSSVKERSKEREGETEAPVGDRDGAGGARQASLYKVEGIGCLDCANEVEEAIAHLPGVEEADFNPIAGRLAVVGEADLAAIQKIARSEGWAVRPAARARPELGLNGSSGAASGKAMTGAPATGAQTKEVEEPKPWWRQTRQVLLAISASLLLLGLIFEWTGRS